MIVPWRQELRDFVLTAFYVVLAGPVAGLLWWQVAPKLSKHALAQLIVGNATSLQDQMGADVWFLLVSAIAGMVCGVVVLLLRAEGPGSVTGLALGGAIAAIVADRVGYLAQHGHTVAAMQAVGIVPGPSSGDILDFRVRAVGVFVAWPIAALVVHGIAVAMRDRARSLP